MFVPENCLGCAQYLWFSPSACVASCVYNHVPTSSAGGTCLFSSVVEHWSCKPAVLGSNLVRIIRYFSLHLDHFIFSIWCSCSASRDAGAHNMFSVFLCSCMWHFFWRTQHQRKKCGGGTFTAEPQTATSSWGSSTFSTRGRRAPANPPDAEKCRGVEVYLAQASFLSKRKSFVFQRYFRNYKWKKN